jgi:maltose alpha-D-glucosyltransferase/alpha-amylase
MLVQVEYVAGEARRFVVPIAFRKQPKGSPAEGMPAESDRIAYLTVKGEPGVEDQTGFLFDALSDKGFALSLLDAFARHRRFRGTSGELLARTTSSYHRLRELAGSRPEPTHIKGERSNSTIAFGDRLVLKVFRWVEEGVNPEVEIAQALAEKTTFTQTAPVAGALMYHVANGPPMTWARLAKFIPNEGDAWRYTIEALRRYFEHVLTKRDQRPEPLVPKQPFLDVVQQDLPPMAAEWIGSYLEAARLMGRRTAEMHMALASMVDEPAFQPEAFTLAYQRSTFQTVRNWVYRLGQGLRRRLTELPEDARDDAQLVLGREADIIQHLQAILGRRIVAQRMRCHCDLRLSNLLFTGKDFVIIDFEGEVLRPLGTRRHKRTPLRDVAAWLHSMTFAVQTVLRDEHLRPEDRPIVEPWGRFWQWWASAAFMKAYLDVARAGEFLPRTREDMQVVLDYCLMGRAIYELRHCLFSQPQQIQIPLGALLQLLQDRDRRHAAQPPDIALAPGTNPDVSSA